MDIINYIKQIMKEQNISQSELARRVGVTRQAIFEALGKKKIRYDVLNNIIEGLGYTLKIKKADGSELDVDENSLYRVIIDEAPQFGKLENILYALGYKIHIVKKAQK